MTRYVIAVAILFAAVGAVAEFHSDQIVPEVQPGYQDLLLSIENPTEGRHLARQAPDAESIVPENPLEAKLHATSNDDPDSLLLTLEDSATSTSKAKARWGKVAQDVFKGKVAVTNIFSTGATAAWNGLTSEWKEVTDTAAWKATSSWATDSFDSSGDFTSGCWDWLTDLANEVASDVEQIVNNIGKWFQGMQCSLGKDALTDMLETAFSANPSSLKNLKSMYDEADSIKSGATATAASACVAVWTVLEATNPMVSIFAAMLSTFRNKCPFIAGNNVAVSLGVSLDVSGQNGLWSQGAGVEIGVAYDFQGDKYCYVGGCISRGLAIPPAVEGEAGVGVVLTLWEKPDCIAGQSQAATIGAGVEIPLPGGTLGVEVDVTYIFESNDIKNFYGIAITGSGEADTGGITTVVEADVSTSLCDAVCIGIDGEACGTDKGEDDTAAGAAGTTSSDWVKCADEGGTCQYEGKRLVRYGANNAYTTQEHELGTYVWEQHGNNYQKCSSQSNILSIASASDCQLLAEEGSKTYYGYRQDTKKCRIGNSCTLQDTSGPWNTFKGTIDTSGVSCSNSQFGDPISGVVKECYVEVTGDSSGWAECSSEYETCSFSGSKIVKYGANDGWSYQMHEDGVYCGNGVFGDPIANVVKKCYIEVPFGVTWTHCSSEDETCSFSGTKIVKYGANGGWSYQMHEDGVYCGNGVFGDPINGVVKECYTYDV